jgi:hypothetical protein
MNRGRKAKNEIEILAAPTSNAEKLTKDFFIRIKELPQMKLNKINKPHARAVADRNL